MKCESPTVSGIAEILQVIIQFTQKRRQVLLSNLQRAHCLDFEPVDLPVKEFSQAVEQTIAEHVIHQRLIWRDTQHVRFTGGTTFHAVPLIDTVAATLLGNGKQGFREHINKCLRENALNLRAALCLLKRQRPDLAAQWAVCPESAPLAYARAEVAQEGATSYE